MDRELWSSVKEYFAQLMELPESQRGEEVETIRASNPEVASMLESLLAREGETLENDPFSPAMDKIREAKKYSEPDLIGSQIGKYLLKFLIGVGGMGRVYLADRTDLEAHQQVAVKIINAGYLGEVYAKRFDRERKILSRLNHPHITRIYDGGIAKTGAPYIVMEFVEGKPLLEYASELKLSLEKRLELFLDLCAAVAYAHQNFIMHRDLKPGNVLVTHHGIVKVIDFGIAKILEDNEQDEDLTVMGYIPLTPAYASPEQLKGEPLTVASDLYSLGVILYELITGRKPYPGDEKSDNALARRIRRHEPPTRPSARVDPSISEDSRSWTKALRGDLDNIVLKALKEDPTERYKSVDQLAEDIGRYRRDYPVIARPDSLGYRFRKYARRNRSLVFLGAMLLLILAAGIAATLWQAGIARAERDQARLEASKANEITLFVTNLFDHSDPDKSAGKVITSENMLARGSENLSQLADQPALQAEMYRVIGDLYRKQSFFGEAEAHLLESLLIFRKLHGSDHLEVAKTKLILSELYTFTNQTDSTISMGRDAARIFELHHQSETTDHIKSINYIGRGLNQMGHYGEALELLFDAASIAEAVPNRTEREALALASVYNDIATSYNGLDEDAEYLRYVRKALGELIRATGEDNQNVAAVYNNIGHSFYFSEQYDSAEFYTLKALAIADRVYAAKPNDRSQFAHCHLAKIYTELGRFDEALVHANACNDMAVDVYGPESAHAARGLASLGDVYLAMGDYDNAVKYRSEATAKYESFYNGPSAMLAWHYWDEAYRYGVMGKFDLAVFYQEKCLAMYEVTMPDAQGDIAEGNRILAGFCRSAGDSSGAQIALERSLAGYAALLGEDHETTAEVRAELEEVLK